MRRAAKKKLQQEIQMKCEFHCARRIQRAWRGHNNLSMKKPSRASLQRELEAMRVQVRF
jgi:hypothetical protein